MQKQRLGEVEQFGWGHKTNWSGASQLVSKGKSLASWSSKVLAIHKALLEVKDLNPGSLSSWFQLLCWAASKVAPIEPCFLVFTRLDNHPPCMWLGPSIFPEQKRAKSDRMSSMWLVSCVPPTAPALSWGCEEADTHLCIAWQLILLS